MFNMENKSGKIKSNREVLKIANKIKEILESKDIDPATLSLSFDEIVNVLNELNTGAVEKPRISPGIAAVSLKNVINKLNQPAQPARHALNQLSIGGNGG